MDPYQHVTDISSPLKKTVYKLLQHHICLTMTSGLCKLNYMLPSVMLRSSLRLFINYQLLNSTALAEHTTFDLKQHQKLHMIF